VKSHMVHNRSAAPTPVASRSVTPSPVAHLSNGNGTQELHPLTRLTASATGNDKPLGSCIKS